LSNSVVADGLSYLYLYKYCNLLINEVCVATGCWSQRAAGRRVRGGLDSEQAPASMGRRPWRQVASSLNNWLGMAAAASGRRRCRARGGDDVPFPTGPGRGLLVHLPDRHRRSRRHDERYRHPPSPHDAAGSATASTRYT
jgi:hypothetical protein